MQISGKNNFPGRLFIVGVEGGVSKAHLSQRSSPIHDEAFVEE
jgi:hypothetical protein